MTTKAPASDQIWSAQINPLSVWFATLAAEVLHHERKLLMELDRLGGSLRAASYVRRRINVSEHRLSLWLAGKPFQPSDKLPSPQLENERWVKVATDALNGSAKVLCPELRRLGLALVFFDDCEEQLLARPMPTAEEVEQMWRRVSDAPDLLDHADWAIARPAEMPTPATRTPALRGGHRRVA